MHLGERRVGVADDPVHGGRLCGAGPRRLGGLGGARQYGHGLLGYALLQQQVGSAHQWVGGEPALDGPVEQHVREREQAHALVMGHEAAHDRMGGTGRQPGRRVVDGLVHAVAAQEAAGRPGSAGCE